jgi:hypothetical protein
MLASNTFAPSTASSARAHVAGVATFGSGIVSIATSNALAAAAIAFAISAILLR